MRKDLVASLRTFYFYLIYSISLSSHTRFIFYVYFMLTVAPGGNNLGTICSKDFLGLATINMYKLVLLLLKTLTDNMKGSGMIYQMNYWT